MRVDGLVKHYDVSPPWLDRVVAGHGRSTVRAVQDVTFKIGRGETLALVGESGCGKTTVAKIVAGLELPTGGRITFGGTRLQMVFQDPYASLNARWRVKDIIAEPIRRAKLGAGGRSTLATVSSLLEAVGLSAADGERYPHEFSTGQRQRISIARALAAQPELLVLDEPTSSLDVSVQAQILNLLHDLQVERDLAYLFISHDLAAVAYMATEVAIMYLGRIVERAPWSVLVDSPSHPYTRLLLGAIPGVSVSDGATTEAEGEPPNPLAPPPGCAFHPRCPFANARCRAEVPELQLVDRSRIACHGVDEGRLPAPRVEDVREWSS